MKRICSFILLCLIAVSIASCSFPVKYPQEGIYYCEELGLSIDFSIHMEDPNTCAKLYNEDGTYQVLECRIDFGSTMFLLSDDDIYLAGKVKFKDDKFILRDDKEYVFWKQPE